MKKSEFGKRLAAERKRLGLNVADMAERCGIKASSQYLYEKGDRSPNSAYLEAAFSLGVRPHALFDACAVHIPLDRDTLKDAFFRADAEGRDNTGRLLDVALRFEGFTRALGLPETGKRKAS